MVQLLILLLAVLASSAELPLGKPALVPAAEAKELLRAVCPGPIVAEKEDYDKGALGCANCPAFVVRDWVGAWNLETVHYGHFTNPMDDEAALAMSGCAPHSLHIGATVLLTRTDGRWRMKWFQRGLITNRCLNVSRVDRLDLLVCETEDGGQGMVDRMISAADFSQRPAKRESGLLHIGDNTGSCGAYWDEKFVFMKVEKAEYTRVAFADSKLEVSFDFGTGSRAVTENEYHVCEASFSRHDGSFPAGFLPRTEPKTVKFNFDGEKFTSSPSSAGAKHIVER